MRGWWMVLGLVAASACADPLPGPLPRERETRWYLQIDNDVVFGTDRWYTSGVRIARVAGGGPVETEVALLQEVYTPDPIDAHPNDRSPTARLLATIARHDRAPTSFVTYELALGVRGPGALGEQATRAIHQVVPARHVEWSGQEGDQLDAQLTAARSDSFGALRTHVGAVAGTEIAFAHAGAAWTWGAALDSPVLRFAPTPPWDAGGATGWGGFVGASARYVARNEMLVKPYEPWMDPIEREKAVGRLAAGVSWRGSWGSLVFAAAVDSREFAGQAEPHRFGSLTLHVPF